MFYLFNALLCGIVTFPVGTLIARLAMKRSWPESFGWGVVVMLLFPMCLSFERTILGQEPIQSRRPDKPEVKPVPPLEVEQGDRVGRDHPLHHPKHEEKKEERHEEKKNVEKKEHEHKNGVFHKPEAEKFHPIRKLFRGGVEFTCGMLGMPGMFAKFIGTIEICGLICVVSFFGAVILGFGYIGLRAIGVIK